MKAAWRAAGSALLSVLLLATSWPHAMAAPRLTAAWAQKAQVSGEPIGPGGRGWVDLIYDPALHKTVLFGGSGGNYFNDIFQYNAATDAWTGIELFIDCNGISGFVPPTGRDEHVVEYDAYNNLYWVFGGSGYGCKGSAHSAQSGTDSVTIYDNLLTSNVTNYYKDWTVQFSGKLAYVSAYDPATRKLTLATPISGLTSGSAYNLFTQRGGGTWHYSPATRTWTGFDGPHWGYIGPTPGNRLSPAFAYSTRDKALLMFGGEASGDTWALDVTTKSWVKMLSSGLASPPARAQLQNSMVYDSLNDVFVLFGGRCKDSRCIYDNTLDDTWIYKLSTNTWTRMAPLVSPPARAQHHMAYDSINHVVVLFGGLGHVGNTWTTYNDLWIYDYPGNAWTQLATMGAPSARWLGGFAQDTQNNLFVLYGGNTATSTTREVWQLTLQGGMQNQAPSAVASVSLASGDVLTTFQFDGAASSDPDGTITNYQWNFGDGGNATGALSTHQYTQPGIYTVVLTVTDNLGATATTTLTINVTALATPPQISVTNARLTGSVNDPSVTQITANGNPVPVINGTFEVSVPLGVNTTVNLEATGSGGTSTKSVTISVP